MVKRDKAFYRAPMKIVAISDTHERHKLITLPDGDVLVHAGDITKNGSIDAIREFAAFMQQAPHTHKIVIAGNHDFCFENELTGEAEEILRQSGVIYLRDSGVTIDGVKFWGSPWQPWFFDWAFNLQRGSELAEKWALIPEDTNVLITHGPPYEVSDCTIEGLHVGCEELSKRIEQLHHLKLHIFGHIHEGYGIVKLGGVTYANASICDVRYRPVNAPLTLFA